MASPHHDSRRDSTDSLGDVVSPELLAPLLVLLPHELGLGKVKLARAEETEKGLVVPAVVADRGGGSLDVGGDQALGGELLAELGESSGLGLIAVCSIVAKWAEVGSRCEEDRYRWVRGSVTSRMQGAKHAHSGRRGGEVMSAWSEGSLRCVVEEG